MDFQLNDARPDGVLDAVFNWSDELGESAEDSASWSYVQFRSSGTKSGVGYSTADDAAESINRTPVKTYLFMEGTDGYGGEGPGNLFDNNVTTKFCTGSFPMRSVTRLKSAMVIDGIIMATANDNSSYNGRNPNDWKIEGSTDNKNWEVILSGDETFFDEVDFTYFAVPIEDTPPYRYIRFTNKSAKSGTCQIAELVVCSTEESIKNAASKQEEIVPVDKDSLVNYESPARLAALNPAEPDIAGTGAEPSSPGGTGMADPSRKNVSGALPGVIAAGVIVVGIAAAAFIVPKIHKED